MMVEDEADLARRAASGEREAFDLLYECYFARVTWYFTIFGRRKAKVAVEEVMTLLFGSLTDRSGLTLAERAYRLACTTELRLSERPARASQPKAGSAKSAVATNISK